MHRISFIILLLLAFASSIRAQLNSVFVPCNEIPNLIQNYYADIKALDNVFVAEGSPEIRERYNKLAADYLKKLDNLDFKSLPQGCKADYVLFRRDLNEVQFNADKEAKEYESLKTWFPFADTIYNLEKIRRRGGHVEGKNVASNFTSICNQIKQLQLRLAIEKNISIIDGRRSNIIISGMQQAIKNIFSFYNAYDPNFSWWVPNTYKNLDSVLTSYGITFKTCADKNAPFKDSSGIVGFPIGRDEIIRQLQNEYIDYTPEELIDIANKEFAWCDKELLKATKEMGFGNDWKKAQEKVKQTYVEPGEQPAMIIRLYNESVDFLKKKDLITIPPLAEETWRMVMMSPKLQLTYPFFYGGNEFAISYPTNSMDFTAQMMSMRGNNPHFSRATVQHEMIPGHWLQEFMNEHVNTYRHYPTPFWMEGWALYWEMTLWNEGFPQSPEDRIGMLFWRMHRCARIIFSLNYHTGKWSPQQCIDFLIDRVGHEKDNAVGEVRRSFTGNFGPLYQIGYMIGGLEFMALKNEILASGKMNQKQFHDAVMRENSMPIEMLRNILTNQPILPKYQTHWKFYKG